MKYRTSWKLRTSTLLLLVSVWFSYGCGCEPRLSIEFSPEFLQLGPGDSGQVKATTKLGGSQGPSVIWMKGSTKGTESTLASWGISPEHGASTFISASALNDFELDGSYYLGNANVVNLHVLAHTGSGSTSEKENASGFLGVVVYQVKLEETYRSIKPTYVAAQDTVTKQRVVKLDTDGVYEIKFGPSDAQYTFSATGKAVHSYWEQEGPSLGTSSQKLDPPTITVQPSQDRRSVRVQASADFTGAKYGKEISSQLVTIELTIIAKSPSGREVKTIVMLSNSTNCIFC